MDFQFQHFKTMCGDRFFRKNLNRLAIAIKRLHPANALSQVFSSLCLWFTFYGSCFKKKNEFCFIFHPHSIYRTTMAEVGYLCIMKDRFQPYSRLFVWCKGKRLLVILVDYLFDLHIFFYQHPPDLWNKSEMETNCIFFSGCERFKILGGIRRKSTWVFH